MSDKYSDGTQSVYAELPVPAAYLKWTRGNAALAAIAESDPGAFFGGWRAFVKSMKDETELPQLPIPVVTRVSQDGKHKYEVYASNVVEILPLVARTRFELREETINPETGRKFNKVVAVSKKRMEGYTPYRQVFGLVFAKDSDEYSPAVLKVFTWSSFIAFEKAGRAWGSVNVPAGKALVRRFGTVGENGAPKFEYFGQGHSTPIDAVGISNPRFVDDTQEIESLWKSAQSWKECEAWNATGEAEEPVEQSALQEFAELCKTIGLSDTEIQQVLSENSGDYAKAVSSLRADDLDYANSQLEETDDFPY